MTTYTISGVVESIGEAIEVGANGFTKREVVLETREPTSQYPNPVALLLKKDRVHLADDLHVGDRVNADVTIDGRRWDGPNGVRHFTDLTAWKFEVVARAAAECADGVTVPKIADQDELLAWWKKNNGGKLDGLKEAIAKACPGKSMRGGDFKREPSLCQKVVDACFAKDDGGAALDDEFDLPF